MSNTWEQINENFGLDINIVKSELKKLKEVFPNINFDFIIFKYCTNKKRKYKLDVINHSDNITEFISNHKMKTNKDTTTDIIPIKMILKKYKLSNKLFYKKKI